MTGLEQMRAFVLQDFPAPPVAELIGFRFESVSSGRAVMRLDAERRHMNPMGTLHGGVICDLGDAAMGGAVASTLAEGESYTTIELKANFFKPVREDELTAEATVVRTTRTLAYVECDVSDSSGSLVARLASTCMVLRGDAARGR